MKTIPVYVGEWTESMHISTGVFWGGTSSISKVGLHNDGTGPCVGCTKWFFMEWVCGMGVGVAKMGSNSLKRGNKSSLSFLYI